MEEQTFENLKLQTGDKIKVDCNYLSETLGGALEGQQDYHEESIEGYYRGFHPNVSKHYYRDMIRAHPKQEYNSSPAILIIESSDLKGLRDITKLILQETDLINTTQIGRVMHLDCIEKIKVLERNPIKK